MQLPQTDIDKSHMLFVFYFSMILYACGFCRRLFLCLLGNKKEGLTKPMKKIPKGLADYDITTEEVVEFVKGFFNKYENYI